MKTVKLISVVIVIFCVSSAGIAATKTSTGTGNWNTAGTWSPSGVPGAGDSVIIASGHTVTLNTNGICGAIRVTGTLLYSSNNNRALTVSTASGLSGDVIITGTFTFASNNNQTLTLGGNFTCTGTLNNNSGGGDGCRITFNGTGTKNVSSSASIKLFDVNSSSLTLQATSGITITSALNVLSGTLNSNGNVIAGSGSPSLSVTGTLVVSASTYAGSFSGFSSPTINAGSTVEYSHANPTINAALTYQNLHFSGTGTTAATGTLTIQDDLTNTGGGTLNFGANGITLTGNLSQSIAGFTSSGTVSMTKGGGVATLLGNATMGSLSVNGGGGTLNLGSGLSHQVNGTITLGNGTLSSGSSTLSLTGNFSGNGGTFTPSTGTVNFNGSSAQVIDRNTNTDFNNLTVNNSAGVSNNNSSTKTVSGTLTLANGVFTLTSALSLANGATISRDAGSFSGTPVFGTSVNVAYTGSTGVTTGTEIPSGATVLSNLTMNKSGGIILGSSSTVNGVLTLTNGNISTGSNTLNVSGTGSVARTSGHVIGNLKKTYVASANKVFEIGTANGYSPVTVNATGSGDFTVTAFQGVHPNVLNSNVINRYWTLTNGGMTSADLTFQYLAGDVVGNEANYAVSRYTGSGNSWAVQGGTVNTGNHTASVTGVSSFSDWTVGESSSFLTVSIDDTTLTEGNSGTVNAGFTVSLSGTSSQTVTVDYITSNGSATIADGDYNGISTTTLTFNPGESSKQINVLVNGDTKFESDEAFNVDLSNPSNASISDAQGIATITNDDAVPAVSIDDVSASEGNSGSANVGFTVSLSNASEQTITVDYATSDGSATTADIDYTGISTTTLTFNPGETSKPVNVSVNGDTKFESNETFNVDLSNVSNATIADAQGVGTITNDDTAPTVSIDDVTANEGNSGSSSFGFTVSLSAVSGIAVTVDYATSNGSATIADGDYTGISTTTLTFNPGETSKPLNVSVNGDTKFESIETFNVDLSNVSNATIADSQGVGSITNDDGQPTVTVHNASIVEGNAGTVILDFTVDLSNASFQTITFEDSTIDGSATLADNDYDFQGGSVTFNPGETSKIVSVVINGDTKFEANETFTLSSFNLSNATFADAEGTGTITNDDASPTLSIDDVAVNEGNSGSSNVGFIVSLSNPSAQTVTVDYATSNGSALAADADYVAISTSTLTFNPGETSKPVDVSVNGDTKFELNEDFNVDLSNANNAAIADAQGVGTITNDDGQPTVTLQDASITEGNSGTVSLDFTVNLSNASYQTITFEDSTIDGNATLVDNDYNFESGVVTFNPGETSKTVSVVVNSETKFELNETLTLSAFNLSNATFADDNAEGTITNDDNQPTVTVHDANVFEGNAGTVMLDFTIELSNASYQTITFEDSTNDGTATLADNDYEFQDGIVSFNPGETSKTVSVVVNGDNKYESNESLSLEAFNLINATVADAVGAGTILNDDAVPSVSINDVTQAEGNSGSSLFGFTVSLSNPSSQTITVDYATSNGTATTADNDYSAVSTTTLMFNPGETSKLVNVSANGDVTFEPNENFNVDLSNASNAAIADAQGTGTITNDDAGSVISINDVTVNEGNSGSTSFGFTLSLSNPSSQTITVDYATSNGTATDADADYVEVSATTVTFNPGETSKPVNILVNGDDVFEVSETFKVDLSNAFNASISDAQGVGTITNDDSQPAITVHDASVTEGNAGTVLLNFTADLSNASYQTVTFEDSTLDGSATLADNDYVSQSGTVTFNPGETSKSVSVTINGDVKFESNEVITLEGFNPVNATFADALGTGTINNDDALPSISINDVTVAEGNSGSTTFGFTVNLSAISSQTITVDYATSNGTATSADNDYSVISTTTLTFNPGETSKPVNVSVTGDTQNEANETFNIDLSNPSNVTIADGQGIGTITNDDGVPSISISDVSANEGNSGSTTFGFTVNLSVASGQTVRVDYATSNGSATVADNDYTAISTTTLTFNPGETSKPVNVSVTGDTKNEVNETLNVDLSNPSNATIADAQGVGTITNDDGAPMLSISDVTANEGNSGTTTFGFTVSLSSASGQAVTVDYSTSNGSATVADNDYTTISTTTLTFNPGETSKPVNVSVTGDVTNEANETFNVDLSNASNASIADAQGVGTITNDDGVPTISISDVSANEGNSGSTTFGFTVNLSVASGQTVTVDYATSNGSATVADNDYTAISTTTLTFNPGETSKPVNVSVTGDTKNEVNETLNVDLSNPSNATIADAQGAGTINNDDGVPSLSINSVSSVEGNTGTTSFDFTVSLSAVSGQVVTVEYGSTGSTANAADYQDIAANSSLTFNPGETSKLVTVLVIGDSVNEADETFLVGLSNPANATVTFGQGTGTIQNDDAEVLVSVNDVNTAEGDGGTTSVNFIVSLSAASGQAVTVQYATANGSATTGDNDFVSTSNSLTFNPGETSKSVSVTVNGDLAYESDEYFNLLLSNPINGMLTDSVGVGTIVNDDNTVQLIAMNEKWNIVSVPLTVSDYGKTSLFPTATTDAFSYIGGNYSAVGTLENGRGYWVKFSSAQSVSIGGSERVADTIDVEAGWNMIGSLSTSIPVSSIGSIPGGIVTSVFFGYNTSYYPSSTVEPGRGYWVKASQAGQLILSSTPNMTPANRIRIVDAGEIPPPAPDVVGSVNTGVPDEFALSQNYPNPFNPVTRIQYALPVAQNVTLKIYNMMGQEVAVLVNGMQDAGYKVVSFEAGGLPSGMYVYKLTAGTFTDAKKMLLVK